MRKYLNLRSNTALGLIFAFLVNTFGPIPLAQADDFHLPAPGVMVDLSPEFNPPILKGIKVHPDDPFKLDFILDQGDEATSTQIQTSDALKQQAAKLIKYFLASLTIPEKDLWVNLSPYEKNRIVPESFGQTEMGRDLLAEDYLLKQITASLIYPEGAIGKKFWKRIYEEAAKRFGTTNIPVNTFNKVWIVPEKSMVYENAKSGTAYIVESKLKVMLEQDYLAFERNQRQPGDMASAVSSSTMPNELGLNAKAPQGTKFTPSKNINALGSQIVREIVIPELTKEVNEDKNFSQLRQVYNSFILATWYKKKIKDSILAQVYENKNKIQGLVIPALYNRNDVEFIYQRYLQAFKKGAYNYIKEEVDPLTQQAIPRKYFSGGVKLEDMAMTTTLNLGSKGMQSNWRNSDIVSVHLDASMTSINPLINPRILEYEGTIKGIVNPLDQELTVVYGAAGADMGNVMEATNAGTYYMAAQYPDLNAEAFEAFKDKYWDAEGYFASIGKEYRENKFKKGYASVGYFGSYITFYLSLIEELHSLGLQKDQFQVIQDKGRFLITFDKQLPDGGKRTYRFYFINVDDLMKPETYSPQFNEILAAGFDVYFQNAALNLPKFYADFLPYIGRGLRKGGYFVTDDHYRQGLIEVLKAASEVVLSRFFKVKRIALDEAEGKLGDLIEHNGYGITKTVTQKLDDSPDEAMAVKVFGATFNVKPGIYQKIEILTPANIRPEDTGDILNLNSRLEQRGYIRERDTLSTADVEYAIKQPDRKFIAVYRNDEGKIVGYFLGDKPRGASSAIGRVKEGSVDAAYANGGIGTALMAFTCAHLVESLHVNRIWLVQSAPETQKMVASAQGFRWGGNDLVVLLNEQIYPQDWASRNGPGTIRQAEFPDPAMNVQQARSHEVDRLVYQLNGFGDNDPAMTTEQSFRLERRERYKLSGLLLLTVGGLAVSRFFHTPFYSESIFSEIEPYLNYVSDVAIASIAAFLVVDSANDVRNARNWEQKFNDAMEYQDLKRASKILRDIKVNLFLKVKLSDISEREDILSEQMRLSLDRANEYLTSGNLKVARMILNDVTAAFQIVGGSRQLNSRIQHTRIRYAVLWSHAKNRTVSVAKEEKTGPGPGPAGTLTPVTNPVSEFLRKALEGLGLEPGASRDDINRAYGEIDQGPMTGEEIRRLDHNRQIALRWTPDLAMNSNPARGGIDLTSDKALIVQNGGQGIQFHIDPAQLQRLEDARGLTIGSMSIQPLKSLPAFLGINQG